VVYERFSRAATTPCATAPRLTLSGDRRRRLRRLARQLGATLGGEVQMVERAGDPAVVERFLALEALGWKGRGGSAMACRPGHADFVREVCRAYAEAGRLRLHTLEAGGRIAAVICELRAGDGLFLFKIAHDPHIGRYSPGTQLVVASCESSDARWIDSGAAPGASWLNDLFPEQRMIASLLVSPEGPTGKLLASGVGAFVAARNARGGRGHQ
jgi:CelD/BcsL family acetyltransferase involved in cellulose biosynthesis